MEIFYIKLGYFQRKMQLAESSSGSADHRLALIHEMSSHNFDLIRFASYRTAVKLRFIQKKVCCEYDKSNK